jgi:putative acetyltransferase
MYPEEGTVAEYINEHDIFREKCAASDVPYFEIRENYEEEIANVYAYIDREKKILEYDHQ